MSPAKKTLVVVESPSKAKTINKYLGSKYKVTASVGHIIDLPKSKFGVNIEDGFKPQYIKIRGKEKIIKELKTSGNKASQVLIATDPDREGEAIAYHIYSIMDHDKTDVKRVEFNEITKTAVENAINSPRPIDMAKVYSQQARRVLDRIVGYEISPVLWKTVYRGLSAGRVQSVALRLVCEREQEIREFKPEEFWTIDIDVKNETSDKFTARLIKIKDGNKFVKSTINTESDATEHVKNIKDSDLLISSLTKKEVKKQPVPPFITSTMQQAAARVLRFSTSRIMRIAQQLYEGVEIPKQGSVGLITYMRTDSFRISQDALNSGRKWIESTFGNDYLPEKPNYYKSKKSAQDAHEAIRPTYLSAEFQPEKLHEHLSNDQYKLYNLIWKRFIASQMNPAKFDKTVVEVTGGNYLFKVEGEVLKFEGFLKVYGENLQENGGNGENGEKGFSKIPAGLKEKDKLELLKIDPQQNFTKPPPRFSESTLVKELDKQGIGRPSTYAQIITTIIRRKYVEKNENKLFATELGETINSILVKHFPKIFNVKFTAELESELDKIATNDDEYESVLNDFYSPFKVAMDNFNSQKDKIKSDLVEKTEEQCEKCGKTMIVRWGRNGKFLACSGYPECKSTKPIEEDELEAVDEKCDKCGNPMVMKVGRFGKFLACSNYPECKNTKPIPLGIKCPKEDCKGDVIQRKTKKGRTFYGCSNYPKCDFVSWNKPVNESCSNCSNNYLLEKYSKAKGNFLECPECKTIKTLDKTSN